MTAETTETTLEPGPYSIIVLQDNQHWDQPVYLIGEGWTARDLKEYAVSDLGGFLTMGLQRDEYAPEEAHEILGDLTR
jgi:hypothetical protein